VASGIAGPRWSFEGFLPRRGRERRERLARLAADERTAVLFEAPGRLAATLADLAAACGAGRPAAVCRELTKLHEETLRGSLGTLSDAAAAGRIDGRGEIVIVVGQRPAEQAPSADAGQPDAVDAAPMLPDVLVAGRAEVARLVAGGLARGEAARRVAAAMGLPRRRLYDAPDSGAPDSGSSG
jgi:16S rRNA (cytidine1402-2'-O)-methyltransferase